MQYIDKDIGKGRGGAKQLKLSKSNTRQNDEAGTQIRQEAVEERRRTRRISEMARMMSKGKLNENQEKAKSSLLFAMFKDGQKGGEKANMGELIAMNKDEWAAKSKEAEKAYAKRVSDEAKGRRAAWEEWQEQAAKDKPKQMYSWIKGSEVSEDMMIKEGEDWTLVE